MKVFLIDQGETCERASSLLIFFSQLKRIIMYIFLDCDISVNILYIQTFERLNFIRFNNWEEFPQDM